MSALINLLMTMYTQAQCFFFNLSGSNTTLYFCLSFPFVIFIFYFVLLSLFKIESHRVCMTTGFVFSLFRTGKLLPKRQLKHDRTEEENEQSGEEDEIK